MNHKPWLRSKSPTSCKQDQCSLSPHRKIAAFALKLEDQWRMILIDFFENGTGSVLAAEIMDGNVANNCERSTAIERLRSELSFAISLRWRANFSPILAYSDAIKFQRE